METGRGHLGDQWNTWKGRAGRVLWLFRGFYVLAPTCVGYGPRGWYPWASIERTDRILVFMCPVSLVAGCQQRLGFAPLLQWLSQERNWVWTCGLVSRCAMDYVGSPFSQKQWPYSTLLMTTWKVATYGDCLQEAYIERMWTGVGSVHIVLIGFFLTGCTSIRITTTLEYE
jgi:hypothetical protein